MKVAHGHHYCRVPKKFHHRHYIHASIQQAGRERVTQRVPRDAFDPCLLASESETRTEINKRFPGLVVIENEFILSAYRFNRREESFKEDLGQS